MALNRARVNAQGVTLTDGLSYQVTIEFFDSAVPATVLRTETFVLPLDTTTDQLIARVVERGQTIRFALAALASARAAVPALAETPVP